MAMTDRAPETRSDWALRRLRTAILTGEFPPGTKLRAEELAEADVASIGLPSRRAETIRFLSREVALGISLLIVALIYLLLFLL